IDINTLGVPDPELSLAGKWSRYQTHWDQLLVDILSEEVMAPNEKKATFSDPEIYDRSGYRTLRITAELIGCDANDVVVRPAEDRLYLLDKDDVVLTSYRLPESVDPFTIEADVSDNGTLVIEAPLIC
ncbi:hypothetical protein LSH36_118g04035, partial [Paralvinella palmiformis]